MGVHEREPTAARKTPFVNWTMAAIGVTIVALVVLGSRRREANMRALCRQYYAEAHTATDTLHVDGRIIAMLGKSSTTCRRYRVP
jgi:hypothetical protein